MHLRPAHSFAAFSAAQRDFRELSNDEKVGTFGTDLHFKLSQKQLLSSVDA
jgi:hypothetical protein